MGENLYDPHVTNNIVTATTIGHRFISHLSFMHGSFSSIAYFCENAPTSKQEEKRDDKDEPARKGMIEPLGRL